LPAHRFQRGFHGAEVEDGLSGPKLLRGAGGSLKAAPSGELSLHRGGRDLAVGKIDTVSPRQEPVVGLEHEGMHRTVSSWTRPAVIEPLCPQEAAKVQQRSTIT
jgi:hypothetical protein